MSAIEDTRKVLQDFLAPELREISARLTALEKRMDAVDKRMDSLEARMDKRFDDIERKAESRHEEVLLAIRQLANYNELRDRMTRLEARETVHQ